MQNRILGAVPGIAGAIEIYKYNGDVSTQVTVIL